VDIPEDVYVVYCSDRMGAYFSLSSDANGDDIIVNDLFDGNSIIEVRDGEYFEISRGYAVPLEETLPATPQGGYLYDGFYIVGRDLPAGEYRLESTDDAMGGYYAIYEDFRQDDIISNDLFEGSSYVDVGEGQYLKLNTCRLKLGDAQVMEEAGEESEGEDAA